ncbi:related to ribosomal protein L34, mitochondrial [Rhynchosporium agropyri]|uniref:Large ribosomal subunit protein bL34m n=1 Tax=Rhynchosporium agropyri TaxID=914238 RepID=A0A1E1JV03_9HELO|nr:related to ribosomal protein L34, mitochondrial [Rhynchosporium agropyri]
MLCLGCSRGLAAAINYSTLRQSVSKTIAQQSSKRTFTSLRGPSRPTLFQSSLPPGSAPILSTSPTTLTSSGILSNLCAPRAFSTTSVLGAPRDTFDPSHFVRKRRHGFLSRLKTRKGRAMLKRRLAKRRSTLSH